MSATARAVPPGGWAAFFDEHGDALVRAAGGILRRGVFDSSDADDVVLTVMQRLISAGGVPVTRNPFAYAIRAVQNEAIDRVRRQQRHIHEDVDLDTFPGIEDIEVGVDDDLLIADVLDALDELPDNERVAIRGKFLDERPWRDVAAEIGITTSQGFMKVVNRGLERLRGMPRFANLFPPQPSPSTTTRDRTP